MPSPVVPVPGVGQVGQGLQNTWGLEEEEEDGEEENDNSVEEQEEKVTRMEEEEHKKEDSRQGYYCFFNLDMKLKERIIRINGEFVLICRCG